MNQSNLGGNDVNGNRAGNQYPFNYLNNSPPQPNGNPNYYQNNNFHQNAAYWTGNNYPQQMYAPPHQYYNNQPYNSSGYQQPHFNQYSQSYPPPGLYPNQMNPTGSSPNFQRNFNPNYNKNQRNFQVFLFDQKYFFHLLNIIENSSRLFDNVFHFEFHM